MKTFLFSLISFVTVSISFAQNTVLLDSLKSSKETQEKVVIRCGGNLSNNENPLYITDGAIMASDSKGLMEMSPDKVDSITIVKEEIAIGCYGSLAKNGVVLITTKNGQNSKVECKQYPFKVFTVKNDNWILPQDMYNAVSANVLGITINGNNYLNTTPSIQMRGDDDIIVIVDGIRFDASILSTLNPADIESVKVSNNPAAQNYFRYQ